MASGVAVLRRIKTMPKITETAKVLSQENLSPGVYSMWIETSIAKSAAPGQFISIYTKDASKLLPRPISICEIDPVGKIRIVYRIAGAGTSEFSQYEAGDDIKVVGPLGNGFYSAIIMAQSESNDFAKEKLEINDTTKALLIGGGIGVPPMLGLAKALKCEKEIVVGYRNDNELFLLDDLKENGNVYVATDDGSFGTKGTVIDAIKENNVKADIIFACGPKPMLRGVKSLAEELGIPAYISMEERMACGVGACLGCVCQSSEVDGHSNVKNKRVCVDGPVFLATEVEL